MHGCFAGEETRVSCLQNDDDDVLLRAVMQRHALLTEGRADEEDIAVYVMLMPYSGFMKGNGFIG